MHHLERDGGRERGREVEREGGRGRQAGKEGGGKRQRVRVKETGSGSDECSPQGSIPGVNNQHMLPSLPFRSPPPSLPPSPSQALTELPGFESIESDTGKCTSFVDSTGAQVN